MYDREAIARSMSEAACDGRQCGEELDTTFDDESDITMPDKSAWPSSRKPFNAGDLGRSSVDLASEVFTSN